jgi:membrane protein DedA with SNARE-associated domain
MARRAYTRNRHGATGCETALDLAHRPARRYQGVLAWQATLTGLFVLLVGGGIGLPLPEDLTLLAAGVLARQHLLRLREVIAVGFAGVVCADWIIYLAGRRYGRGIVELPVLARVFGGAARLDAVRSTVERHGARAVFAARFMLGFRMVTFLAAGTFEVSAYRFALAEAAGSAIFVPAMATLGYLFSDRAERLAHDIGRVQHWLVLLGLLALTLYLGLRAWIGRTGLGGEGPAGPESPRGGQDGRA